ncbi:MAG: hypothetical protein CMP10_05515 [Zetaproteobacteria bacterium]|nr:hypothetical protein [Pseudobdellovibrionaceae bacterium]
MKEDILYQYRGSDRYRLFGSVTSNSPDDPKLIDLAKLGFAYERLWRENLSFSLGYEGRNFNQDRNRAKKLSVFGPKVSFSWLTRVFSWGATFIHGSLKTDIDNPNGIFIFGLETSLTPETWPKYFEKEDSMLGYFVQ